jgi:hypothetical protein
MEPRLQKEMTILGQMLRRAQYSRALTAGWLAAAAVAVLFLLVQIITGWTSQVQWIAPLLVGVTGMVIARRRCLSRPLEPRAVVSAIEREHPELRHWLSAAVEQQADPQTGEFGYLQLRVVDEILQHPERARWEHDLKSNLAAARKWNVGASGIFLIVALAVGYGSLRAHPLLASRPHHKITVTPGDTEVERGTSVVISARFSDEPPAEAALVLLTASGKTQHIALERHLADPVFGASLNEVTEEGIYHIEYPGGRTRDYKLSVFDYPALVRADAHLQYPAYTGLTNRTVPDTVRVSAVEGTRLSYFLQLNKPVTHARLVARDRTLDLQLTNNAMALLSDFRLTNTVRFSLALEDAQGRTNKFPTDFVLAALTNQRPELKVTFPHGDQRVSRLEEMQLQGEATDDFGLLKYGVGYSIADQDPHLVELGQTAPGNQKRSFSYLLALEKLRVEADQVVAYFIWADDYGPDGNARRTYSDIYFAEVRPFDEIFRADQSGMAGGENGGQGGQPGNRGPELAELQKEIIIATWKLQREKTTVANMKLP